MLIVVFFSHASVSNTAAVEKLRVGIVIGGAESRWGGE